MKLAMSIDVEDWFQVENLKGGIKKNEWDIKSSRVERNVDSILQIMSQNDTKGTFFILGWIAERFPELIKKIHKEKHEIACHGHGHDLIYNLSKKEFYDDIYRSKTVLEQITGEKVLGYRAPNFSITDWAIDILIEHGFIYDSSLFPAMAHDRYGKLNSFKIEDKPYFELKNGFYQVTLSCVNFFGKKIPWAGGGYFRIIPYFLFSKGIKRILDDNGVFVFYIHPWEFDSNQPYVKNIKLQYKMRHYFNLDKTHGRFSRLVSDFNFTRIMDILPENINENNGK